MSDPWLKKQRLEESVYELERIRETYQFNDLDDTFLSVAQKFIQYVLEGEVEDDE